MADQDCSGHTSIMMAVKVLNMFKNKLSCTATRGCSGPLCTYRATEIIKLTTYLSCVSLGKKSLCKRAHSLFVTSCLKSSVYYLE